VRENRDAVSASYLTQDLVEPAARTLVRGAARTLDIASPWVEAFPLERLLGEALPRVRAGELRVRLVYRVAEESDLRITDLSALEALAEAGVQVRYSRRLHAKLLIADGARALIGSSNLTRRGGYGYQSRPEWRNEEGGVLLEEAEAVASAQAHFDAIWEAASEIAPELLGVVMDFPDVREFRFVAIRDVAVGQLVCATEDGERCVVGEVTALTSYNQSFPQMTEEMFLTQGLAGVAPRRVAVPDIPSLFSHPVKDQGFLVAKTYFRPESAFRIGRVRVLRAIESGRPVTAAVPVAPGSDVLVPEPALLRRLLGDGDVRLGRMHRHPEVGVWLRSRELLSTHLAVLGMTGSGKSNAVKHLVRALAPSERGLRVFVIDTHGEYATCSADLDPVSTLLDVSIPDRIDLLDFDMVKEHFSIERMSPSIKTGLRRAARGAASVEELAALLEAETNETLQAIGAEAAKEPERFCIGTEPPRVVRAGDDRGGQEPTLAEPGLYVLDLRGTETFEVRARKCAVLCERVFLDAKLSPEAAPALVVVDEAHNYVPERTTGFMAEASRHGSLHAVTTIAVEGRKFGVGLVIVSQRPSRVAKDVLAQASTQLVFRLTNLEDLQYVRESFEAAGSEFLTELPQLDRGVCIVAGSAVEMPVRCDVPLFAPRHRFDLGPGERPPREALARAVEAVVPEPELLADEPELVVYAGPELEVTVRSLDGQLALDVDCADEELVERVRGAVMTSVAKEDT
jgi:DNA helicase HerA-like ATPase